MLNGGGREKGTHLFWRARATWMMLKHQTPYEARLMFPG